MNNARKLVCVGLLSSSAPVLYFADNCSGYYGGETASAETVYTEELGAGRGTGQFANKNNAGWYEHTASAGKLDTVVPDITCA